MDQSIIEGVPGRYWHRLEDGRVQCDLCPRYCKLHEGQRGLCFVRARQNDLGLEADEFASARHARFEPRRDGVWVEDVGSTNGTFVNGARLEEPRRLRPGDVVRIGDTDLRFDR